MAVYCVGIHDHCKTCFNANCNLEPDGLGSNSCDLIDCPARCGLRFHRCKQLDHRDSCIGETVPCLFSIYGCDKSIPRAKMTEHMFVCPAYVVNAIGNDIRRDEYDSHITLHHDLGGYAKGEIEGQCPLASYGCDFRYARLSPKRQPNATLVQSNIFNGHSFTINEKTQISKSSNEETDQSCLSTIGQFDKLDVNTNTIVQQSSNNCSPMSHIHTEPKLQRTLSSCDSDGPLGILSLPVEVIVKIFSYMDSYSLNNVSLTCHILRDVCSTLLVTKGIAIPETTYYTATTGSRESALEVSRLRWKFSVCSSGVPEWTYHGDLCLLQHLQVCPFNSRDNLTVHTEPFKLPSASN